MRLYQTAGGTPGTTRFGYDGLDLIAEYNSSNALQRRYVHGPSTDEPIVWYEGSGTTDRRFLHSDERGSVVSVASGSGTSVNTYDEYGIPRSSNTGRFQYTGQTWLPELGMYYYKARVYSPTLGRFLQPDPIGYGAGMNRYAYVGGNPVNSVDPLGLRACVGNEVMVVGQHLRQNSVSDGNGGIIITGAPHDCVSPDWLQQQPNVEGPIFGPPRSGLPQPQNPAPRPVKQCEMDLAGAYFSQIPGWRARGWDLSGVEFRYGLDSSANSFSRLSLNSGGAGAVTQMNTVFVSPNGGDWSRITDPKNAAFWEEVVHSQQFYQYGRDDFYFTYGMSSAWQRVTGGDSYNDNRFEKEAKAMSQILASQYRTKKPCAG